MSAVRPKLSAREGHGVVVVHRPRSVAGRNGQPRDARPGAGWVAGLLDGLPVALGYFPTAAAFGLAARQAGLSPLEALLMSALVYAGASQFALVGMLGAPAVAATAAALLLNLRHVLYGPPLAPHLSYRRPPGPLGWLVPAVCAFGLTDEVFAVASARLPGTNAGLRWLLAVELTAYGAWLCGTWVGAAAGEALLRLLPAAEPALGFALPSLFVALLASTLGQRGPVSGAPYGQPGPAVRAAVAAAGVVSAAMMVAGLGSWAVVAGTAAGLAAGWLARRWGGAWSKA